MTSLVAWIGVDNRLASSLNFASDSRISWGTGLTWDYGRKVFACEKSPHILAYIGDVVFASVALSQIASSIDAGVLFAPTAGPADQFRAVAGALEASFEAVPDAYRQTFTALFGLRERDGMALVFHLFSLGWSRQNGWHRDAVVMPNRSSALRILGSGGTTVSEWHGRWEESSQGGTSRAIFSSFCDALASGADPCTGGAPQMVRIYRQRAAGVTGVFFQGRPYLLGLPLQAGEVAESIEWRNELFERCDSSGVLLRGAQRHGAPRGLGPASREGAG